MTYSHITAEHLGSEATTLDVAAYNAALDYLADDGDQNDEWLWNDGDFFIRLRVICGQIVEADSDSPNATAAMRETAAEFIRFYDAA